ncbi:hypothetical protein D083_0937 [Dickeya solani RNS 08.23.3.1.A]|nr:hypothetical protein D083_0937 [Dickeya solani RNS 08.23.3.1.A]
MKLKPRWRLAPIRWIPLLPVRQKAMQRPTPLLHQGINQAEIQQG